KAMGWAWRNASSTRQPSRRRPREAKPTLTPRRTVQSRAPPLGRRRNLPPWASPHVPADFRLERSLFSNDGDEAVAETPRSERIQHARRARIIAAGARIIGRKACPIGLERRRNPGR